MTRAVALGIAVLLAALPGEAQELTDRPLQSPRSGGVWLRLGFYRPQLGDEAGLTFDPYERVFGTGGMLLAELELESFFYQGFGTAGVSFSAGYAEKFGRALLTDDTASSESTGLRVAPLRLHAVYRLDWPAFNWGIPLVPYVKPGLVYIPWWITKGSDIETVDGYRAAGGTWGFEVVGGVSLLLDVLEPRLARDFDSDIGVNHSYLFAEYTYTRVNDFGGGGLNLSDGYWMFGLALDY